MRKSKHSEDKQLTQDQFKDQLSMELACDNRYFDSWAGAPNMEVLLPPVRPQLT